MNCDKYMALSIHERNLLTGETIHILQNDDECFQAICKLINKAKKKGVFEGVTILPNNNPQLSKEEENNCIH